MLIDPLPRSKRVAVRFAQFIFIEYFFSFFDFSIDFVTHSFKADSVVRIIGPKSESADYFSCEFVKNAPWVVCQQYNFTKRPHALRNDISQHYWNV